MRAILFSCLALLSCATTSPVRTAVTFVDESETTADGWVCLFLPADSKHEKLLCMDVKTFMSRYGGGASKTNGVTDL